MGTSQTVLCQFYSLQSGSYLKYFPPMLHMIKQGTGRLLTCNRGLPGVRPGAGQQQWHCKRVRDEGWHLYPQALLLTALGLGPPFRTCALHHLSFQMGWVPGRSWAYALLSSPGSREGSFYCYWSGLLGSIISLARLPS